MVSFAPPPFVTAKILFGTHGTERGWVGTTDRMVTQENTKIYPPLQDPELLLGRSDRSLVSVTTNLLSLLECLLRYKEQLLLQATAPDGKNHSERETGYTEYRVTEERYENQQRQITRL